MTSISSLAGRRNSGFSLLEMMVAIAILSLALGSLYQAASGATRNVRTSERYAYGVELARSLLANHSVVPVSGVDDSGETSGGYSWRVASSARESARGERVMLHDIEVSVAWFDGSKRRQVSLNSVVEGAPR